MPKISDIYSPPPELVLGTRLNARVPEADQTASASRGGQRFCTGCALSQA